MPRKRITEDTLYKFDELSEEAQDKAIENLWDLNVSDSFWYEFVEEDIEHFGEVSGLGCRYGREFDFGSGSYIHIDDISTTFSTLVDNLPKVKAEFGDKLPKVIEDFINGFTARERRWLLRLEKLQHIGTLSGKTSTDSRGVWSDVERHAYNAGVRITALINKLEANWQELLRDLEHYYVTLLRDEYEYQTSREQITESIRANEYEFYKNGRLA